MASGGQISIRAWVFYAFVLACVAVSCLASYIALDNRRLRSQLRHDLDAKALDGVPLPKLYGAALSGADATLEFPSAKPVVVVTADRTCQSCEANWVWWRRVVAESRGTAEYRVLDTRGTFTESDAKAAGIPGQDVIKLAPASSRLLTFATVPTIAVISRRGVLVKTLVGVLNNERLEELRAAIRSAALDDNQ